MKNGLIKSCIHFEQGSRLLDERREKRVFSRHSGIKDQPRDRDKRGKKNNNGWYMPMQICWGKLTRLGDWSRKIYIILGSHPDTIQRVENFLPSELCLYRGFSSWPSQGVLYPFIRIKRLLIYKFTGLWRPQRLLTASNRIYWPLFLSIAQGLSWTRLLSLILRIGDDPTPQYRFRYSFQRPETPHRRVNTGVLQEEKNIIRIFS
jgi:hypothetical protein